MKSPETESILAISIIIIIIIIRSSSSSSSSILTVIVQISLLYFAIRCNALNKLLMIL
jgi:hypothetical protein